MSRRTVPLTFRILRTQAEAFTAQGNYSEIARKLFELYFEGKIPELLPPQSSTSSPAKKPPAFLTFRKEQLSKNETAA